MNIVSAVILCTIVGAVGAIVLVAAEVHGGGGRPALRKFLPAWPAQTAAAAATPAVPTTPRQLF